MAPPPAKAYPGPPPAGTRPPPKTSPPPRTRKPGTNKPGTNKPGTGGGGSTPESRANAREDSQRLKAGQRYEQAAKNLEYQIKALKDAILNEFGRTRDQNLKDIDTSVNQQILQLKESHGFRAKGFLTSAEDSTMSAADTHERGYGEMVRERQDSMNAILEQGAGETDAMRAMLLGTRNWHANASEANRAYYDSLGSVNQGITDLNLDIKTALSNAHMTAEGERDKVWGDFYSRRSEAYTQLGNLYGQQAEYMDQAKEMGVKMGAAQNTMVDTAKKGMQSSYQAAADESGKSYVQKPLPGWIKDFTGQKQVERRQSNTNLAAAVTVERTPKAEGATLRKWAA